MAIAPLHHPADLHYLMEHQVWARLHGDGTATVGVTELGIRLSGEIYMCRAKRLGTAIALGGTHWEQDLHDTWPMIAADLAK